MMNSILSDLLRVIESLPSHPIAPEHRGYARLLASPDIARGSVYRLAPLEAAADLLRAINPRDWPRPWIVMNDRDVDLLRQQWGTLRSWIDVDQEIADCCEQIFAEREATR